MKFVLFLYILLTSLNVYALAPTLVSQSGNSCVYDDGTVLKSWNCPFRLHVQENKRASRPILNPDSPGIQMLLDNANKGNEMMSLGIIGMKNEIDAYNKRKKMEKVLDEYPDAYTVMKERDFLNWIGTDDRALNFYIQANDTKNPSPVALEALLVGYKIIKMSKHPKFSEWMKTLNHMQKENIKKSLKKGDKGDFSEIKNWLSKWDAYMEKKPVTINDIMNNTPDSLKKQKTTNQKIMGSSKFAISESDVASLSSELKELVPKAKDGNLRAQYNLGLSFVKGEGAKKDRKLGINILEASAEKNHFSSQYALGTIYEKEGNYAKAARWYGRAANLGHLESQFRFGWFYTQGDDRGVTKDLTKAKYWFKKASESGHPRAQYLLGVISYGNGETLEAYKWLHISEQNGLAEKYIKSSENYKNKLAKELTEGQIEYSKRVAIACIESSYKNCNF